MSDHHLREIVHFTLINDQLGSKLFNVSRETADNILLRALVGQRYRRKYRIQPERELKDRCAIDELGHSQILKTVALQFPQPRDNTY